MSDRTSALRVTSTRREWLQQALAIGGTAAVWPHLGWAASSAPASAPAERWRIGCSTRPWDQQDWPVGLEAIAEAGYKYIGLMTSKPRGVVISAANTPEQTQEVREELRKRRLRVITVYGGGFPVEPSIQAGVDHLRKLIDHCAMVESESVMLGGTGNEKAYDAYYKVIAECCDYAAGKRVMIVLKPHGGLNTDGPQCRRAIEKVNHPNFRLWYDAGNIFFYTDGKVDPVNDSKTVDGIVAGWCIKDFKQPPKEVFVNPGDGMVNFKAVLANLRKGGFTGGPLMVETIARGSPTGLVENARNARRFIERLVADAERSPSGRG
jgi:sugar phosphate isomerase/epimerase